MTLTLTKKSLEDAVRNFHKNRAELPPLYDENRVQIGVVTDMSLDNDELHYTAKMDNDVIIKGTYKPNVTPIGTVPNTELP